MEAPALDVSPKAELRLRLCFSPITLMQFARLFWAVFTFLGTLSVAAADQPPNLILILADDLGWADLACYGNRYNETPRIDQLAREGTRFTQAYAGPVCSPTRANIQTGQDQARYGITQHIPGHRRPYARLIDPSVPLQLPLEAVTAAERLGAAGYRTGYFGKWHLGEAGFSPAEQGWQQVVAAKGHLTSPGVSGRRSPERTAKFLTDQAIDFIQKNQTQPFFIQVAHYAVHIPLTATPEDLARFQAKPPAAGYPSRPEYAALLSELDTSVGRLVDEVDRLGLSGQTLIVFVSDNGGLENEQNGTIVTSNAPLRSEKGTLYEGGIRVPAIARWPGRIPAGAIIDEPIITQDLHPTFTSLAGVKLPADVVLDGRDLSPLLLNPPSVGHHPSPRDLFWHLPHYHHSTPASAIRSGHWKLIEFLENGHTELYNLTQDIGETTNLAAAQPDQVTELVTKLHAWRQSVGARLPTPNPHFDPTRASELSGKKTNPNRRQAN